LLESSKRDASGPSAKNRGFHEPTGRAEGGAPERSGAMPPLEEPGAGRYSREVRLNSRPDRGRSSMSRRRAMLALTSAAGLIALTGGCTAFYWSKPGATSEQFTRDSQECAREAAPTPRSGRYGVVVQDAYRGCLQARGYVRSKQWEPVPAGYFRGVE